MMYESKNDTYEQRCSIIELEESTIDCEQRQSQIENNKQKEITRSEFIVNRIQHLQEQKRDQQQQNQTNSNQYLQDSTSFSYLNGYNNNQSIQSNFVVFDTTQNGKPITSTSQFYDNKENSHYFNNNSNAQYYFDESQIKSSTLNQNSNSNNNLIVDKNNHQLLLKTNQFKNQQNKINTNNNNIMILSNQNIQEGINILNNKGQICQIDQRLEQKYKGLTIQRDYDEIEIGEQDQQEFHESQQLQQQQNLEDTREFIKDQNHINENQNERGRYNFQAMSYNNNNNTNNNEEECDDEERYDYINEQEYEKMMQEIEEKEFKPRQIISNTLENYQLFKPSFHEEILKKNAQGKSISSFSKKNENNYVQEENYNKNNNINNINEEEEGLVPIDSIIFYPQNFSTFNQNEGVIQQQYNDDNNNKDYCSQDQQNIDNSTFQNQKQMLLNLNQDSNYSDRNEQNQQNTTTNYSQIQNQQQLQHQQQQNYYSNKSDDSKQDMQINDNTFQTTFFQNSFSQMNYQQSQLSISNIDKTNNNNTNNNNNMDNSYSKNNDLSLLKNIDMQLQKNMDMPLQNKQYLELNFQPKLDKENKINTINTINKDNNNIQRNFVNEKYTPTNLLVLADQSSKKQSSRYINDNNNNLEINTEEMNYRQTSIHETSATSPSQQQQQQQINMNQQKQQQNGSNSVQSNGYKPTQFTQFFLGQQNQQKSNQSDENIQQQSQISTTKKNKNNNNNNQNNQIRQPAVSLHQPSTDQLQQLSYFKDCSQDSLVSKYLAINQPISIPQSQTQIYTERNQSYTDRNKDQIETNRQQINNHDNSQNNTDRNHQNRYNQNQNDSQSNNKNNIDINQTFDIYERSETFWNDKSQTNNNNNTYINGNDNNIDESLNDRASQISHRPLFNNISNISNNHGQSNNNQFNSTYHNLYPNKDYSYQNSLFIEQQPLTDRPRAVQSQHQQLVHFNQNSSIQKINDQKNNNLVKQTIPNYLNLTDRSQYNNKNDDVQSNKQSDHHYSQNSDRIQMNSERLPNQPQFIQKQYFNIEKKLQQINQSKQTSFHHNQNQSIKQHNILTEQNIINQNEIKSYQPLSNNHSASSQFMAKTYLPIEERLMQKSKEREIQHQEKQKQQYIQVNEAMKQHKISSKSNAIASKHEQNLSVYERNQRFLKEKEQKQLLLKEEQIKSEIQHPYSPHIRPQSQNLVRNINDLVAWKENVNQKNIEIRNKQIVDEIKELENLKNERLICKGSEKILQNSKRSQNNQKIEDHLIVSGMKYQIHKEELEKLYNTNPTKNIPIINKNTFKLLVNSKKKPTIIETTIQKQTYNSNPSPRNKTIAIKNDSHLNSKQSQRDHSSNSNSTSSPHYYYLSNPQPNPQFNILDTHSNSSANLTHHIQKSNNVSSHQTLSSVQSQQYLQQTQNQKLQQKYHPQQEDQEIYSDHSVDKIKSATHQSTQPSTPDISKATLIRNVVDSKLKIKNILQQQKQTQQQQQQIVQRQHSQNTSVGKQVQQKTKGNQQQQQLLNNMIQYSNNNNNNDKTQQLQRVGQNQQRIVLINNKTYDNIAMNEYNSPKVTNQQIIQQDGSNTGRYYTNESLKKSFELRQNYMQQKSRENSKQSRNDNSANNRSNIAISNNHNNNSNNHSKVRGNKPQNQMTVQERNLVWLEQTKLKQNQLVQQIRNEEAQLCPFKPNITSSGQKSATNSRSVTPNKSTTPSYSSKDLLVNKNKQSYAKQYQMKNNKNE